MCADETDRLLCVVHRVGLRVVAVLAKPVAQDRGVDAVVVEEVDEVRPLGPHVQRVVSSARHENHERAGVDPLVDGMDFDRWIVDVDDALDPSGDGCLHVVDLGFGDPLLFEERRIRRIQRQDDAAGDDWLRRVR